MPGAGSRRVCMSGTRHASPHTATLPALPMDAGLWTAVAGQLKLGPQQARIAEMVLRGLADKEMAAELGISKPTLRGYVARLHRRVEVADRLRLVVRLFQVAMELQEKRLAKHHA